MPSGGLNRAARRGQRRPEPPKRSTRRLLELGRRRDLRRRLLLRAAVGEDAVEPLGRLVLVHVLGVHQLAGEDLLRLDEHLLLAGRKTLLVVTKREVPDHLGELEDVPRFHLVAVVLEAPVPVLGHLGAAAGEGLEHLVDHLLVDHLAQTDGVGVLGRDVHRHVVVEDLDRHVLPLLPEHCAGFFLYNGACTVVRIHHLVADLVQADPPFSSLTSPERRRSRARRRREPVYLKLPEKATISRDFRFMAQKALLRANYFGSRAPLTAATEASLAMPTKRSCRLCRCDRLIPVRDELADALLSY